MTPETVPAEPGLTITVRAPLRHLCPIVDEVDDGHAVITWRTLRGTFELHSLRKFLDTFATQRVTHEGLTDHLFRALSLVPSVRIVDVVTTWETAGMGVTCSILPTLADQRTAP